MRRWLETRLRARGSRRRAVSRVGARPRRVSPPWLSGGTFRGNALGKKSRDVGVPVIVPRISPMKSACVVELFQRRRAWRGTTAVVCVHPSRSQYLGVSPMSKGDGTHTHTFSVKVHILRISSSCDRSGRARALVKGRDAAERIYVILDHSQGAVRAWLGSQPSVESGMWIEARTVFAIMYERLRGSVRRNFEGVGAQTCMKHSK